MSTTPKTKVVILGSGVTGLTIAHVLTDGANADQFDVSIVARDLPEDFHSQGYASPWAGANWSPMNMNERLAGWEKRTVEKWREMVPAGLVMHQKSKVYGREDPSEGLQKQYKAIVGSEYTVSASDLPNEPELKSVATFSTNSINPRIYLPYLKAELEKRGVTFTRQRVISLDEVCEIAGEGGVVVNATALGARSLLGVEDTKLYPIRGQTILVQAPNVRDFVACEQSYGPTDDHFFYYIPRPEPSDEALIGGTYQPGNWDLSVNWDTASAMWETAKRFVPALNNPDVRIKQHNVGLRPAREGGPRVETEVYLWPHVGDLRTGSREVAAEKKTTLVLHSYGFGGAGYQQSWGAAEEAVDLLKKALSLTV
ncbi:FAD dependent oxidoreductase [Peniophora sp. CONT]|nr:FAD dependent oxidoreductase [Peniophora sp. CONT]